MTSDEYKQVTDKLYAAPKQSKGPYTVEVDEDGFTAYDKDGHIAMMGGLAVLEAIKQMNEKEHDDL